MSQTQPTTTGPPRKRGNRASSMTSLASCPGLYLLPGDDVKGPAADTGTAVGRMIELWHQGVEHHEALERTKGEKAEFFPAARMDDVERMFDSYTSDPRNLVALDDPESTHVDAGEVLSESLEADVAGTITDPTTGRTIDVGGHLDQARLHPDGVVRVWDVKSGGAGRMPGAYVQKYVWQLAAYTVALDTTRPAWVGDHPVECGGIILLSAYPKTSRAKDPFPPGVFQSLGIHDVESCRAVLDSCAWLISLVESGTVPIFPGEHCSFCPGGSAPSCLSLLREV